MPGCKRGLDAQLLQSCRTGLCEHHTDHWPSLVWPLGAKVQNPFDHGCHPSRTQGSASECKRNPMATVFCKPVLRAQNPGLHGAESSFLITQYSFHNMKKSSRALALRETPTEHPSCPCAVPTPVLKPVAPRSHWRGDLTRHDH